MTLDPSQIVADLFWLVLYGSGPTLLVAAITGLVIAIAQGVMQINDQAAPQAAKTAMTFVALIAFAGFSFYPLFVTMKNYLEIIPIIDK